MNEKQRQVIANIKKRLGNITRYPWWYNEKHPTHGWSIHYKRKNPNDRHGIGNPENEYGVIGTSEWIWMKDSDGYFIAHAPSDIEYLLGIIEELERKLNNA